MTGRLFTVIGPSGAGKDTILNATLKRCPHVHRIRRVITRDNDAGGEEIDCVDDAIFDRMKKEGSFDLTWSAHGLQYGIPKGINERKECGETLVFNGSRKALPEILARFPMVQILLVNADEKTLKSRLINRGREKTLEISARLQRTAVLKPLEVPAIEIDNSGDLDNAVKTMEAAFKAHLNERV